VYKHLRLSCRAVSASAELIVSFHVSLAAISSVGAADSRGRAVDGSGRFSSMVHCKNICISTDILWQVIRVGLVRASLFR